MKARELGVSLAVLQQHLGLVAHGDGVVHLQPMSLAVWSQAVADLRRAGDALFDPSSLLSDDEVLNAAISREACIEGVLEQLTDEALVGELAKRGRGPARAPAAAVVLDQVLEVRAEQLSVELPDLHPTISAEACRAELELLPAQRLYGYVEQLTHHGEIYWLALLLVPVVSLAEAESAEERREALVTTAATALHWIEALDQRLATLPPGGES